jgi:hypothetical protein
VSRGTQQQAGLSSLKSNTWGSRSHFAGCLPTLSSYIKRAAGKTGGSRAPILDTRSEDHLRVVLVNEKVAG